MLEIRKTISNTYCSMGNFTLQSQKQVISVPFSLVGIKKAGNHFDSLHGVLLCFCVVLMITFKICYIFAVGACKTVVTKFGHSSYRGCNAQWLSECKLFYQKLQKNIRSVSVKI